MELLAILSILALIIGGYSAFFLIVSYIPPFGWIVKKTRGQDFLDKNRKRTYITLIVLSLFLSFYKFSWSGLGIACLSILFVEGVRSSNKGERFVVFIGISILYAAAYGVYRYFGWLGFVVMIVALSVLIIIGFLGKSRGKNKVESYFMAREIGSISDIVDYTSMDEDDCESAVNTLLKEGSIILLIDGQNPVYRWTLDRKFTEGVTTIEFDLD